MLNNKQRYNIQVTQVNNSYFIYMSFKCVGHRRAGFMSYSTRGEQKAEAIHNFVKTAFSKLTNCCKNKQEKNSME